MKAKYKWSEVDWSRRDLDIARELGCLQSQVLAQRKKRGLWVRKVSRWNLIDWTQSDVQIAAQVGCSRQAVMQQRDKLKMYLDDRLRRAHIRRAFELIMAGRDPSDILRKISRERLVELAHAAAILRGIALSLGGKKRLRINRRKTPRTGQNKAFLTWLDTKPSGFEFKSRESHNSIPGAFSLQQIQNAIAASIRKQLVRVIVPKRGTQPATFAKA